MKAKIKTFFLSLVLTGLMFMTACSPAVSTLVGGEYNAKKDQTDYFVFPYGSVSIPGKWIKMDYIPTSGQQYFTNNDSIIISVAFTRFDKYEFNKEGKYKGLDFVRSYYEWDSNYFVENYGLQRKEFKSDSLKAFMNYRIFGEIDTAEYDTYFLVGEKNGNVTNLSISNTDKWSENEKLSFLEGLYLTAEY